MTNLQENRILPAAGVRRSLQAESGACPTISQWRDADEDGSLNHNRRESPERGTTGKPYPAILRRRDPIVVASFNTCTARAEERQIEIAHCADSCQVEILGVQEHRIAHEEEVKFQRIQNYHLVTSSAWRNEAQASQGGVGLLLSSRAKNALRSVESITKRTLIAEFESNPVTTVIVIYAPTNVAPDDEALEFFENLKSVIAEVPKHNFLMILGDFNARLGSDDAPYTFHDEANRNGKLLSEVLVEHQLLAANTVFQKRQGKRWTFEDRASGLRRQLDYILVRKKWRNSVLNCEPYNTFGSVGSDHRVIGAKIRLSLRVSRKPRRNLLDWQEFSERPDLQEQYSILIRNRFRALQSDDNNLTEEYDKFVQVNDEAKEMFVPVKQRTSSKKKSDHPDVQRARECLHQRRMQYKQEDSDENSELVRVAQEELFKAYRKVKEEELTQQSLMVEREHNEKRYGMAWKVVNSITGRKKSKEGLVKGDTPEQ